jgi:hypothetical protein
MVFYFLRIKLIWKWIWVENSSVRKDGRVVVCFVDIVASISNIIHFLFPIGTKILIVA